MDRSKESQLHISQETMNLVRHCADGWEITQEQFIAEAIKLLASLDDYFLIKVKAYSEYLTIPRHVIIQNTVLRVLAEREAEAIVYGGKQHKLIEFPYKEINNGKLYLTGAELYQAIRNAKIETLKERVIEKHKTDAAGATT